MTTLAQKIWNRRAAILPVIHIRDTFQTTTQAVLAMDAGAQGVFLIDHSGDSYLTVRCAAMVRNELQRRNLPVWVGVNFLGLTPPEAFQFVRKMAAEGVSAIWSDTSDSPEIVNADEKTPLFFGGVAFKYQPQPPNVVDAVRAAAAYTDFITTSGDETGVPPTTEKVRSIATAVPLERGVAVASGVSARNVARFCEAGATAFLVASSIALNGDFHHLDPILLRELIAALPRSP